MPIPLLVPVIASLLAAGAGAAYTNKANKSAARRAEEFSKEQTDTAVQRRVKDLIAAGLNPALAYEGQAQSAPGVMVGQQDVIGAGASGARQGQAMKMAQAQTQADVNLKREQAFTQQFERARIREASLLTGAQARATEQARVFQAAQQPHSLRQAAAGALLSEYQVPGARASAEFSRSLGRFAPATNFLLGSAKTARSLFP